MEPDAAWTLHQSLHRCIYGALHTTTHQLQNYLGINLLRWRGVGYGTLCSMDAASKPTWMYSIHIHSL
jgi:hypothetical protein